MKTKRFLSVLLAALMLATTLLSGIILPAAVETAPATYDSATLLCLLFSSLSAAGIIIGKHSR